LLNADMVSFRADSANPAGSPAPTTVKPGKRTVAACDRETSGRRPSQVTIAISPANPEMPPAMMRQVESRRLECGGCDEAKASSGAVADGAVPGMRSGRLVGTTSARKR